jgi:hypothetical protein
MARPRLKGSTDQSVTVYIVDDTDGTPEQGVVYNTASIAFWYRREGAAKVAMSLVTLASASAAHTDSGLIHVDDGVYRLDLPDAAVASGAGEVVVGGSIPDMVVLPVTIPLVDYNNQDAVRLGLTSLPNAAADAAGGLPISDAGGLDLDAILADTNELQSDDVPGLIAALDTVVDRVEADTQSIETKVDLIDTFVDTEIAAIKTVVDDILEDTATTIPATITTIDNEIAAIDTVVDLIKVDTTAIEADTQSIETKVDALNDLSAADVNTQADLALSDIRLDELFTVALASQPTAGSLLADLTEDDSGTQRFIANALEEAPSGSGGGSATSGKQDQIIAAVITNAAGTDIAADIIAVKAQTAAIETKVDTVDDLIDTEVAAIKTVVDDILLDTAEIGTAGAGLTDVTLNAASVDLVWNEAASGHTSAGTFGKYLDGQVSAVTGAAAPNLLLSTTINAVTDNQNFTLVAGPPDNDVLNGHMMKVTDQTTGTQFATARVADYVASGFDVDLETSPGFTVAAGDIVEVFASPNRIAMVDVVTTNSDMISAASVNAEVDTALADYDAPTLTELQTEIAAMNNVSTTQVRTQMDTALTDIHLDHLFATDYNPAVKPGVVTSWANEVVVSDGGVTQFSANALELGPSGGGSGSDSTLLQSTTIATLASQTSWTVTAGAADNDVYNDRLCVVTDQTTATQKCVVRITDYVGSSKTVTCSTPGFTVATGDTVEILAITALTEAEVNAQADLALTDIGLDHLVSASVAGADVTDNSIVGQMVAADGDWDTFAKATDSLDAIGNTIAGTAGAGAYTVTINVKDTEATPANLENVAVRLSEGANVLVAQTNAAGNAVFALDAATFSYALTKAGYSGETGTTVVTGTGSFAYDIALNAITPSSGSLTSTGVLVTYDESYATEDGVTINVQMSTGPGVAGIALDTTLRTVVSSGGGVVQVTNLIRGATYSIWRGTYGSSSVFGSTATSGAKVSFVVPDAGSFDLPEILGTDPA